MDKEKRKNNGRERTNKGGRPVKGVTEKLKYRVTVKMATEDYYLLKSKVKVGWRFYQRVHSRLYYRGWCKGTAI